MQRCGVCGKGGHNTKSCARGEGKGKTWGLAPEQGASLEQEIAGNAFAASGRTYPNGQGMGTPPSDEWRQKMETEEGAKELRGAVEEKTGQCPVCKGTHKYHRRLPWGSLPWPSDRLHGCKAFQALSFQQRAKVIQDQGGCVVCLSWAHPKFKCNLVRRHTEGGASIGCEEKEG